MPPRLSHDAATFALSLRTVAAALVPAGCCSCCRCRCCSVAAGKLHVCEQASENQCLDQCNSTASTQGTAPRRPHVCSCYFCSGRLFLSLSPLRRCLCDCMEVGRLPAKVRKSTQVQLQQQHILHRGHPLNIHMHIACRNRMWRSKARTQNPAGTRPRTTPLPVGARLFFLGPLRGCAAHGGGHAARGGQKSLRPTPARPGRTPPQPTS